MASFSSSPRSIEDIFKDYNSRRTALLRALTYDVDEFYSLCDPEKENLCLYGHSNESWEVSLPAEEVPPELPEPALGINFARDGMNRRDWLSLVAVHSDCWLLSVAFYFGARLNKNERKRLFSMLNDLPTLFEIVTEKKPIKEKPAQDGNKSRGRMKRTNEGHVRSNSKLHDEINGEDDGVANGVTGVHFASEKPRPDLLERQEDGTDDDDDYDGDYYEKYQDEDESLAEKLNSQAFLQAEVQPTYPYPTPKAFASLQVEVRSLGAQLTSIHDMVSAMYNWHLDRYPEDFPPTNPSTCFPEAFASSQAKVHSHGAQLTSIHDMVSAMYNWHLDRYPEDFPRTNPSTCFPEDFPRTNPSTCFPEAFASLQAEVRSLGAQLTSIHDMVSAMYNWHLDRYPEDFPPTNPR